MQNALAGERWPGYPLVRAVEGGKRGGVIDELSKLRQLKFFENDIQFEDVHDMNKQSKWFQVYVAQASPINKKNHFTGWQKSHLCAAIEDSAESTAGTEPVVSDHSSFASALVLRVGTANSSANATAFPSPAREDIPCDLRESRIRPHSAEYNKMSSRDQARRHMKLLMAACSGSVKAYGKKDENANNIFGDCGFSQSPCPVRISSQFSGANSAVVGVVTDADSKVCVMVAFRGTLLDTNTESEDFTKSVINMLQDVTALQTSISSESLNDTQCSDTDERVHLGFHDALKSIYGRVLDAIRDLLANDLGTKIRRDRIIVTGHSLGGAMAKLFTFSLLKHVEIARLHFDNSHNSFQVACVTFGEPHPGNHAFAGALEAFQSSGRLISFRITNLLDSVPRLLSVSEQYAHSGSLIVLDDSVLQKVLMVSDIGMKLIPCEAENVAAAITSRLGTCLEESLNAHGIDTHYATNLSFYLAPNGIEKYANIFRTSKLGKAAIAELKSLWDAETVKKTALKATSGTLSQVTSTVAEGTASFVANSVSVVSFVNALMGAATLATSTYNVYLTRQVRALVTEGFAKVQHNHDELLKRMAESEQRVVQNIENLRAHFSGSLDTIVNEIKDLLKTEAMNSQFDDIVRGQMLIAHYERNWRTVYSKHHGQANLFEPVIEKTRDHMFKTFSFLQKRIQDSSQKLSFAHSCFLIECFLQTIQLCYLARKGSPIFQEHAFAQFLMECFGTFPGTDTSALELIGGIFLELPGTKEFDAEKLRELNDSVGFLVWNLFYDAKLPTATTSVEALTCLHISPEEDAAKIEIVSATAFEESREWIQSVQSALLSAIRPQNTESILRRIFALGMQLGATVVQGYALTLHCRKLAASVVLTRLNQEDAISRFKSGDIDMALTLTRFLLKVVDVPSLKAAGFRADAFIGAGCKAAVIKTAGFTLAELQNSQSKLLKRRSFTFDEAGEAGFDLPSLKALGFDAGEFVDRKSAKAAGFTAKELKDDGFALRSLCDSGFELSELKTAGFEAKQFVEAEKCCHEAGFTAKDLKDKGFGFNTICGMRFELFELKSAGFQAKDFYAAGYNKGDLMQKAGFTAAELQAQDCSLLHFVFNFSTDRHADDVILSSDCLSVAKRPGARQESFGWARSVCGIGADMGVATWALKLQKRNVQKPQGKVCCFWAGVASENFVEYDKEDPRHCWIFSTHFTCSNGKKDPICIPRCSHDSVVRFELDRKARELKMTFGDTALELKELPQEGTLYPIVGISDNDQIISTIYPH